MKDLYYDLNNEKINNENIYHLYEKRSDFREEHLELMLKYFIESVRSD